MECLYVMNFEGVGTAIVTPFKDGDVDYESYRKLVEWQVELALRR